MFATIRHFLSSTSDTRTARRQYFDLVAESETMLRELKLSVASDRRARQLGLLALCELGMSELHKVAFGPEDAYADSGIRETSRVHELFMEVEHAIAYQHSRRPAREATEREAGRLLDEVVRVGGLTNALRDEIHGALSLTLHPVALKALDSIPFPGSNRHFP